MAFQASDLTSDFLSGQSSEIGRAMAQNQRCGQPTEAGPNKPKIGLLTQTVVPSPTVRFVVPARLRSRFRNDVAFVGERSIQLREVVMSAYLDDVAATSNFDAGIMASKAIRTYGDLPLDVEMKLGAGQHSHPHVLKSEYNVPGHILVLTLDSQELIFLYHRGETSHREEDQFVFFRRPMPLDVSIVERFGTHLAVDPKSRAIAVAAPADFFGIFVMKPLEELQSQLSSGTLNPIAEERFFRLDGDILFMDFLYPESDNENRVILVLIVARGPDTYSICYDWDSSDSLRHSKPRVLQRKLSEECTLPSLLIPLTKLTSFMLVTSSRIVVYNNVLDSSTSRLPMKLPLTPPSSPGPDLLWANWARPYRNSVYSRNHDDIYLCREDGLLLYCDVDNTGQVSQVVKISELGYLDCEVDGGFDTINSSDHNQGGDILVAAGVMGHGGLYIQRAREQPVCLQKFLNWAPVLDAVMVPTGAQARNRGQASGNNGGVSKGRLFVCTGSSSNRGVYELRYGFEARIGLMIPLEDLSSTRAVWAIPGSAGGSVYLLLSDPVSSTLLCLPHGSGEEICAVDDAESGFDSGSQTLAAGATVSGVLVQVTGTSVRLTTPGDTGNNVTFEFPPGHTVLASAIEYRHGFIISVVRSGQGIQIHTGRIPTDGESLGIEQVAEPVSIESEPIAIVMEDIHNVLYSFIGTSDGHLLCWRVTAEGISHSATHVLELDEDEVSKAIESVRFVPSGSGFSSTLFCGLRNGLLVPLSIEFGDDGREISNIRQHSAHRLGQTAVKLGGNESITLATCGGNIWRLSDICRGSAFDCSLQPVWITDQNDASYLQQNVDILTIIPASPDLRSGSLAGSLVCISDGQLLICTVDQRTKTVPRKIDVPGEANRIAYSQHLDRLIVAYTTVDWEVDEETNIAKRYARPHLEFLDPNSQSPSPSESADIEPQGASDLCRLSGSAGERITCIQEWTPARDGERYHFIIIGTARKAEKEAGRVVFLQATKDRGQIKCAVKHVHKFDGPVRALTPYEGYTLMVAAGYDVVPLEPKFSEKKWVRAARFSLISPGVSLTVRDGLLYVTTARESLVILRVVDGKLALYAHDGVKREGLSHLYIDGEANAVLAASRGGTVSALSETGITDSARTLSPIAEAHLPTSIIRLTSWPVGSQSPSTTTPVYGTSMNGSVHRITVLTEKEWRLLRFLQNLCSQDPAISPLLSARKRRWTWANIEPSSKKPSDMHINGDILARLLRYGPDYLRGMLSRDAESLVADAPWKTYIEPFAEIVLDTLGQTEEDPVSMAMDWLGRKLRLSL